MNENKRIIQVVKYDSGMKAIGYSSRGENGIPNRRFYLKGPCHRTNHIHAFDTGSLHVYRHIAFRDYLIEHPLIPEEYGELKSRCARECEDDSGKYCEGLYEA